MSPHPTPIPPISHPQRQSCQHKSKKDIENKVVLMASFQKLQDFFSGTVILKGIVPDEIINLLQSAVKDIDKNKTLHCTMAYFNGPPILHRFWYIYHLLY